MAVPPRVDRTASIPVPLLVGRDRELELLRDHLAATLDGQGRLVLVGGEAGIGKTTLVQAIGSEARTRDALVLTGHCYDLTATPPYGPWLDLAASYRATDGRPPLPAVLAGATGMHAVGDQATLFALVRDFFAAVSATRPLMLVLEDLHWSDPASLDLLRVLGRGLAAVPTLIVVTYRADELDRRHPLYVQLPALVREADAGRVELRRLTQEDVRRLVATRFRLPPGDADRLVAYLHAHAEGIPFYLGELLRTLEVDGALAPAGDAWSLGDLSGMRVPPLLRQVVDGRLTRLGDAAREALAVAAVIGPEVPLADWSVVAGWSDDALLAVIEQAVEARLLDTPDHGATVRFHHALIREALYEGILPPRRRALHRRAGEALVASTEPDPDAVASHFRLAGDPRAVDWLVQAGERAHRAYAWITGAERFEAALGLMADDPTRARERGWLRYRIGRLRRLSDPIRGVADLKEAERLAVVADDPVLAAYALADRGRLRCLVGEMRDGLAEMAAGEAALDALPTSHAQTAATVATWVADTLTGAEAEHASALAHGATVRRGTRVIWLANVGRLSEARTLGESHLAKVEAVTRPSGGVVSSAADAHHGLAVVFATLGQPDAARRANARARAGHHEVGHHAQVAFDALREITEILIPYATTELSERRRRLAEAEAARPPAGGAMATGGPFHLAFFGHGLGLALLEGIWPDARQLDHATRVDGVAGLWQYVAGNLGVLARNQGVPELAWALVREVLPDGPATEPGDTLFLPSVALQRVATELAIDAGDLAAARAWLEAHDRWLSWSGAVSGRAESHLLWARCHRWEGNTDRARSHVEAAHLSASDPRQPLALLAGHRLAGELATEAGHLADAERHLAEALALAAACSAPFERALTLLALAELRTASGQAGTARALLDEVQSLCEPLGAAPALARATALAARLAVPQTAQPGYPGGLSAREVEVLRLVAEGLTDQEVADRLSISRRTVGQHLRSVYNKLGVPARAAATRVAVEQGLL